MSDPSDFLHEQGLQVTAQRLAVLRALGRMPHSSAEHVIEAVRADIGAVSRQAVYDALKLLAEKRLVRRIQLAGSPALYELRIGVDHDHVVCRLCGRTTDVPRRTGETFRLEAAAGSGYRVDDAEVVYWGTCPACLADAPEGVGGIAK